MLSGEPGSEPDVGLDGTTCILARSEELNVVMGFVETYELRRGDVISVSWYVFNSPSSCALGAGRCTLADADSPAVEASIVDQAGGVVQDNGRLYVPLGPLNGGTIGTLRAGIGEVRPEAEIVVILRSHGPAVTERFNEQLRTYDGGCDTNQCTNVQFARLLPLP
jgi:hypothetical protein